MKLKSHVDDHGRVCVGCQEYKPWEDFKKTSKGINNRSAKCKLCFSNEGVNSRYSREYRERNKDKLTGRPKWAIEKPLRYKAKNFRSQLLQRSKSDLFVPSTEEIFGWLDNIQDWICFYSGEALTKDNFSIDHKTPISRGGTHDLDNLCICTKGMNTAKRAMNDEEFKSLLSLISGWEDHGARLLKQLSKW